MYLKSIEVQGFKSFANKLKFEFPEGITGIVGPNGSGKSNVADAVRWVLGEQSAKQLRSGNMQDVIFAGTETRKAQSFASVAITFDNSDHMLDVDYEEVTVTRRLYRSGESEYLLNQSNVRLKDINEIFYDTGIGQEGYSIIGQGQIDRILSGKAEERRELFDEAAGIVKFKKRKKMTLKRLEEEHQNLLRVSDILKELTSRIGPLKKQSETARIYLDLRDSLRELEIMNFVMEEERTGQMMKEVSDRIDIVENEMAETRVQFDRTKTEYDRLEQQMEELSARISELNDKNSNIAVIRQQLIGQTELLKEQIRAAEEAKSRYTERSAQIRTEIKELEDELEALLAQEAGSAQAEQEILEKERQLSEQLKTLDASISETVAGIESKKNEVISMLESRASVKGKIQRYGTMLEQLSIRRSEISGRLLVLREDEERYRKESSAHDEELKTLQSGIESCRAQEEKEEAVLQELHDSLSRTNHSLDEASTAFHRDSSRLESLRAMAENYDGYGNGIRKVMEQKKRNPGIRGVVADLLSVPGKYETAIETALGGSIRNIVTDNDVTAKYLIEFLKSNKFGRATFLPLTSIRPRELSNRAVLKEEGVIGVASSLVSCDDEYRNLNEFLLGRTIVVDHIDHALLIGRKYRHSVYMVTLQGESFSPGGSITGGAFRNQDNLLGRKREIEELKVRTVSLKKETEDLQNQIDSLRGERNAARARLSEAHEKRQKFLLRLNTVQMGRKQAEEQLEVSRLTSGGLEKELADIDRQIAEVKDKNTGIQQSLAHSEEQESLANESAESLRETEQTLRADRQKCADELEAVRVEHAQMTEQNRYRRETRLRLSARKEDLAAEAEQLADVLNSSAADMQNRQNQILEVEEAIKRGEQEAEEVTKARGEAETERQNLSDTHRDFFSKRDALSEHMSRLDREYFRLTSQREKTETEREERCAYMREEYNLTPSEMRAYPLKERIDDRASVRKEIRSVRENIRNLGSVNVNAIDEYKELSERYEFLSAQHEDLIKSEETLSGIIAELDEGMRKQFTEKLADIRTEFDKAFKELFGGGRGAIEIDPDADILEAGISIIAHPPGKKLQNMLQLSGGERALTAIALLFAIQNLKPSPFCLLDEIEAALDEGNVVRFAGYLHKLTKNTQFIIITHRRGTMTAADRLYGITMQEKGVSTLVSVNLIEDKLSK